MGNQDSPHGGAKQSREKSQSQRNYPPMCINKRHQANDSVLSFEEIT